MMSVAAESMATAQQAAINLVLLRGLLHKRFNAIANADVGRVAIAKNNSSI